MSKFHGADYEAQLVAGEGGVMVPDYELRPAVGGVQSESQSVFVVDSMTKLGESGDADIAYDSSAPSWDALPKDVKMYLFGFLPLEDFARLSQVSKSWNRVSKKHPKAREADTRSQQFQRVKVEREIQRERENRRRREAAIEGVTRPIRRCCHWYKRHGIWATVLLFLFLLYVGYCIMVGMFLWWPGFPSGPSTLPASELTPPNAYYFNANCTIQGSMMNAGFCYGNYNNNLNTPATRAVFNITTMGRAGVAAVYGPGSPYFDCNYDKTLLPANNPNQVPLLASFVVGNTYPCYVDPLFVTYYSAVTDNLKTKDFALLNFSSSTVAAWQQTESYRTAGAVLGYIWISITFCFVYFMILASCKYCCR